MENKILLIGAKDSFIGRAIADSLKKSGFEVSQEPADVKALGRVNDFPHIIFVNIEEMDSACREACVYLKDRCIENESVIFFAGYNDDIEEATNGMPASIVAGSFARPVNTKQVGEAMAEYAAYSAAQPTKKHILVVDDSGTTLRTIKGWLDGKYKVSMVNSGAGAMTFVATNKPDLILLDYEMPVCSGPMLLEMLRSESATSDIPVIFLTSKDDKESVQAVLSLKPQGYLLKTLPPEKIIQAVDDFFAKAKAHIN